MRTKVSELKKSDESALRDINNLLKQLVHDPATYVAVSMRALDEIIGNKNIILVTAKDGQRVVGIGLLLVVTKFRGRYGYIEDMMVDREYRGHGIGRAIAEFLIGVARKQQIKTLELSTRPSRVPANNLYQKLGFERKETNVYRLHL